MGLAAVLGEVNGQEKQKLTPELLWKIGRVNTIGYTPDKTGILYSVGTPDVEANKINTVFYYLPISTDAKPEIISENDPRMPHPELSPDGIHKLSDKPVHLWNVTGAQRYKDLPKSNVYVYSTLMYRHWDTYSDGSFNHLFLTQKDSKDSLDLLKDKPWDCPQKPFGGNEDYIWSPDGSKVIYVCKPKSGTAYTLSTNTDLFEYDLKTGKTVNITAANKGYDIAPAFSHNGVLAWLQMKRDGYESDKQDLVVLIDGKMINLTGTNDLINVASFRWSDDGKKLYFIAPVDGTLQLFCQELPETERQAVKPCIQLTHGNFDIEGISGQDKDQLLLSRCDMNHATEAYLFDLKKSTFSQLTHVNDAFYLGLETCKNERRWVETRDHKKMLVWVIFPPHFDASKKYPTLLYCQGGPQSPVTQFYSFRWNFQLMASEGYIVVIPSRRGMPGFGTKWNEQVSKDWGGKPIDDYLSAIDDISREPYVDTARRGCVGASFGGFSVFALAGKHEGRFKTFIAHDGVFDFRSMYGTTDEMWFENWEKGGPYWDKDNLTAQRSFAQSPSNFVNKWNTPIMIIEGGHDYRVPLEQGQQAFQAAQLRGIKSRFLYIPEENHWVLKPQNALVWQREFFGWLKETL